MDNLKHGLKQNKPFVIGICGGTCSGKTTVCNRIKKEFPNDVSMITQDWYYKGGNVNTNFDHPDSLEWDLMVSQVKDIISGKDIDAPVYDFSTHSRREHVTQKVKPKKIIIVEGILIFGVEPLRKLFDMRIFIDATSVIRYQRRMARDVVERGRDPNEITERWNRFVEPCHNEFVEPTRFHAHVTIHNSKFADFDADPQVVQIGMMITYIAVKISTSTYMDDFTDEDVINKVEMVGSDDEQYATAS